MRFNLWMAGWMMGAVSAFSGTNVTIVVTASRLDDLDLMAVDTAADASVIDRETIEQSGAASVPDLLAREANVLVRGTSETDGQVAMRGFGDNAHLRTLVLLDGYTLNRPDMSGISWQSIPLSNVERVEVVRGGQNVLYGDQAVGGVVKITTRSGADAGSRMGWNAGSFGYLSGYAGQGGSLGDLDYYVGVSGVESDGFRTNSASSAYTVLASAVWYAENDDSLSLRMAHTDSDLHFPGPLDYDAMMRDPTQSIYDGSDASAMEDLQTTLIWELERDWGAARVSSGINRRDLAWQLSGIDAENLQYGFLLGPRFRFGGADRFLMVGADLAYDTLDFESYDSQEFSGLRAVTSEAEFERLTCSPYLFAQRKVDALVFNGGVRYEQARTTARNRDYMDSQLFPTYMGNRGEYVNPSYSATPNLDPTNSFDGTVSKRGWAAELSLVWAPHPAWSLWAGYDRLYRYPVLDEVASYQGYSLSDPLNENLDPETGKQFEIGISGCRGEWDVSCTAFYLAMDNEIVFVENTSENTRLNANLGATRRYGVEGELGLDREWYGASVRWTFQEAVLRGGEYDGNRVPLVPMNHGAVTVWVKPEERIRLALCYDYVSEQYQGNDEANAGRMMDAYGLVGLRLNVALNDSMRVEVSVDNLTDEIYAPLAYGGAFYPGSGRCLRMGMHMEF